jgi:hypothetical protein
VDQFEFDGGLTPLSRAMLGGKQRAVLEHIVHISRGPDNVDTHTVEADSQAFDLAIAWAASLGLAADDDVVLEIKLPSGAFKTFGRKDF